MKSNIIGVALLAMSSVSFNASADTNQAAESLLHTWQPSAFSVSTNTTKDVDASLGLFANSILGTWTPHPDSHSTGKPDVDASLALFAKSIIH